MTLPARFRPVLLAISGLFLAQAGAKAQYLVPPPVPYYRPYVVPAYPVLPPPVVYGPRILPPPIVYGPYGPRPYYAPIPPVVYRPGPYYGYPYRRYW